MRDVLVIGAGWAGLTAAAALRDAGLDVLVVEKARGPGGRSSTRRAGAARFDHGAQYFTARSSAFRDQVERWCAAGLAAPWRPRIRVIGAAGDRHRDPGAVTRFVGVPGMNAICRDLAGRLDCRFGARVSAIEHDDAWRITLEDGQVVQARGLVLSCPAPQALALLGERDRLAAALSAVEFRPCISAMVEFETALEAGFDAMFVNHDPALSWVARNAAKPGRGAPECWVLHATADWSRAHLELDAERLAPMLLDAFGAVLEHPLPALKALSGHRWRYAMAAAAGDAGALVDADRRLAVAGDWLAGNRIEGAWRSGRAAAARLAALAGGASPYNTRHA